MDMFLSYTRANKAQVSALVDDLQRLGLPTWLDQKVTGGAPWWREIVDRIQHSDVFLFALSAESLKSRPCQLELQYAERLRIPIIPIQVGDVENLRIPVGGRQIIDYRTRSADMVIELVLAITELAAEPRMRPSPLPKPPPVPFEYLYRLAGEINVEDIPRREQGRIIGELRQVLREEEDEIARNDILGLLRQLRGRPEITAQNEREIDGILHGDEALSVPPVETGTTRLPGSEYFRSSVVDVDRPTDRIPRDPPEGPEVRAEASAPPPEPAPAPVRPPAAPDPPGQAPAWMKGRLGRAEEIAPERTRSPAPGAASADPDGRPDWMRGMAAAAERPGPGARPAAAAEDGGDRRDAAEPGDGWWGDAPTAVAATPEADETPPAVAAPVPAAIADPPLPGGFPRFAFTGTALGALGIPLLAVGPLQIQAPRPAAGFLAAAVLVLTIVGLATAMVAARRGEAGARLATAVAVLGLIGVVVFAATTGVLGGP